MKRKGAPDGNERRGVFFWGELAYLEVLMGGTLESFLGLGSRNHCDHCAEYSG